MFPFSKTRHLSCYPCHGFQHSTCYVALRTHHLACVGPLLPEFRQIWLWSDLCVKICASGNMLSLQFMALSCPVPYVSSGRAGLDTDHPGASLTTSSPDLVPGTVFTSGAKSSPSCGLQGFRESYFTLIVPLGQPYSVHKLLRST